MLLAVTIANVVPAGVDRSTYTNPWSACTTQGCDVERLRRGGSDREARIVIRRPSESPSADSTGCSVQIRVRDFAICAAKHFRYDAEADATDASLRAELPRLLKACFVP